MKPRALSISSAVKSVFLFMTVTLVLSMPAWAASKMKIVTTTTDLAEFASQVGGDRVEVDSIARGYQDPHFVEAKPSFLLKLRRLPGGGIS